MTIPIEGFPIALSLDAWDKIMRISAYFGVSWIEMKERSEIHSNRYSIKLQAKRMCAYMLMLQYGYTNRIVCDIFKINALVEADIFKVTNHPFEEITR